MLIKYTCTSGNTRFSEFFPCHHLTTSFLLGLVQRFSSKIGTWSLGASHETTREIASHSPLKTKLEKFANFIANKDDKMPVWAHVNMKQMGNQFTWIHSAMDGEVFPLELSSQKEQRKTLRILLEEL